MCSDQDNNHNGNNGFLLGLIFGVILGAVLAIVYYRHNKEDVLKLLRQKISEILSPLTPQPSNSSPQKTSSAKKPVLTISRSTAKLTQKPRLSSGVKKSPPIKFIKFNK